MTNVLIACTVLALIAALELWLGVDAIGQWLAPVVLLCSFSVSASLLAGKMIHSMRGPDDADD